MHQKWQNIELNLNIVLLKKSKDTNVQYIYDTNSS